MPRYAGGTVQIITYATKRDGTYVLNTDVDTATVTIYDLIGTQIVTGNMLWDPSITAWYFNWISPANLTAPNEYYAKCTLVSAALAFTNNEWRSFSIKPNPIYSPTVVL